MNSWFSPGTWTCSPKSRPTGRKTTTMLATTIRTTRVIGSLRSSWALRCSSSRSRWSIPAAPNPITYRTHRVNQDLQIWLTEGRDYRSPNAMPDGPDKTMWGAEQRAWLERTLLESDATFKILISPTPFIGPDDAWCCGSNSSPSNPPKIDNHSDPSGFQYERDAFFAGMIDRGLLEDHNFYLVTGDRHWQYHSIHPTGFEEFSTGALVDGNSRLGRNPGDPLSTDPDGLIEQPYTSPEPSGGFLTRHGLPWRATHRHVPLYDERGVLLHTVEKIAK